MDRFYTSPSQGPDEPWFRVGTVEVTTTVIICALSSAAMFVWAISKKLVSHLDLISPYVLEGQVWRLVTWPIANGPSLGAVLGIVMMFLFGREVERSLGRTRFLWFTAALTLVPAAIGVALDISFFGGLFLLEMGMFATFIATFPNATGFFGIPLWVFGVVFIGIQVLQLAGGRAWGWLTIVVVEVALSLLGARAFGLSPLEWIPKVPLPASLAGPTQRRKGSKRPRKPKTKGHATVTPIRPTGQRSTPTAADLLRQAEIDVLLDKISAHGLSSLTPEERRRLDEHSRRLREEGN